MGKAVLFQTYTWPIPLQYCKSVVGSMTSLTNLCEENTKQEMFNFQVFLLDKLCIISFPMEIEGMKTSVVFDLLTLAFLPYVVNLLTLEKGEKPLKTWNDKF